MAALLLLLLEEDGAAVQGRAVAAGRKSRVCWIFGFKGRGASIFSKRGGWPLCAVGFLVLVRKEGKAAAVACLGNGEEDGALVFVGFREKISVEPWFSFFVKAWGHRPCVFFSLFQDSAAATRQR